MLKLTLGQDGLQESTNVCSFKFVFEKETELSRVGRTFQSARLSNHVLYASSYSLLNKTIIRYPSVYLTCQLLQMKSTVGPCFATERPIIFNDYSSSYRRNGERQWIKTDQSTHLCYSLACNSFCWLQLGYFVWPTHLSLYGHFQILKTAYVMLVVLCQVHCETTMVNRKENKVAYLHLEWPM